MIIRQAIVADAAHIARVHVDSWQTTYRGLLPDNFLGQLSYERRSDYWLETLANATGAQFMVVAEADQRVVGFAMGGPERTGDPVYRGELYAIYLLEAYQRQGLGLRLVQSIVERLEQADIHSLLVWVMARSGSRRFYEALGGQEIRSQPITIDGLTFDEVSYGWTDLGPLRPSAQAAA